MNCIIIEDEPAAQSILEHYISNTPDLMCSAVFRDAVTAREYISRHSVDLMFLDINLPEISGISFLRSLTRVPLVIFTTAYSRYAIDGYELEIIDFLLKPFSFERFSKAVNKARERLQTNLPPHQHEIINVRSGRKLFRIVIRDIIFIEACGDYVTIHTGDRKLTVHGTMKNWEEELKDQSFMKVHRTVIVNLQKISQIDGNVIISGSHRLPLSESARPELLGWLLKQHS